MSGSPTEFIVLAVMNICTLILKIKLTDTVRKKLLKELKTVSSQQTAQLPAVYAYTASLFSLF